jgi:hypothetical protein
MELGRRQTEVLAEFDKELVGVAPEKGVRIGREVGQAVGQAVGQVFQQGVAGEFGGLVLPLVLVPDAAFDAARRRTAARFGSGSGEFKVGTNRVLRSWRIAPQSPS